MKFVQELLENMGINKKRVQMHHVSAAEATKLAEEKRRKAEEERRKIEEQARKDKNYLNKVEDAIKKEKDEFSKARLKTIDENWLKYRNISLY